MTAAERGLGEELFDSAPPISFGQGDERNEVARGRVRIGEAELLALGVGERR